MANIFTMKILYIIPRFTTGGAEHLVLQYANYFRDQGHEVIVVSTVGGGELIKKFENIGIKVFSAKEKNIFRLYQNYKNIKKIKNDFQPDIIHTHVFSADFFGYFLRQGVRWISTQHNVGKEFSQLRKKILQWILPKTDQVIAVSGEVEKFCLEELKLKKNKVQKVLNGVEIEKWLNVKNDHLFTTNKMRLAIIGRIEKQKNHYYLFQALAKLTLPWQLNIYGVGSKKIELEKLAKDLKIEDKIIWQGVKDILLEIENIDIVIQPSLWEGLSLVIMETMTTGRIVVASEVAGRDLIENKQTGLLIDTNNQQNLVEVLQWIWNNKEESKKIANTAREKAKNNFGMEKNFAGVKSIYKI